jgi:hypothetical protein
MSKFIFGIFSDEEKVMHSIAPLRAKGVVIKDVISPFPIHGMDHALGLARTRISICSFLYGMTGFGLAILMTWYMMISDWPMDIGGKPNWYFYQNVPAFIPVIFESTIFCAAHGMVNVVLVARSSCGRTTFGQMSMPDVDRREESS